MKLLHLIQRPQNRGAEMFTCQLSNHLINKGHEIKIVAVFEGEADLPFHGKISSLEASSKNRFLDIQAWKKLSTIIKEFNPDIVQANAGDTLKYAVFSKKIYGWKTPIISRNASEVGRYLKSTLQKSLNSFFYKNVAYVISVSQASEKDILKLFPFLKAKTTVIPVGLEPILNILKAPLKPTQTKHIVHVGGFTFEKNHKGLLRIFRSIINSNPNVHLHLVGDGPLKSEVEREVEEMGLNSKITFYGFVNNPLSFIEQSDVLVLPSLIEGLPGVLLEAMYCKTPTIAYNVGGISEIITKDTGTLIKKNDESGFAMAVLKSLNTPNVKQIEAAESMVIRDFMNEELAEKFIKVYSEISNH